MDLSFDEDRLDSEITRAAALAERMDERLDHWMKGGEPFSLDALIREFQDEDHFSLAPFLARDLMISKIGFTVPGENFVERVGRFGPVLEIGAGLGLLTRLLNAHGVEAVATDIMPDTDKYAWRADPENGVLEMGAVEALEAYPGRAVLCAWPSLDEEWATEAAKAMEPGTVFMLIGEGMGGCTGSDSLFETLHDLFEDITEPADAGAVSSWPGIHDHLTVWKKR